MNLRVRLQGGLGNQLFQIAFGLANRFQGESLSLSVGKNYNLRKNKALIDLVQKYGIEIYNEEFIFPLNKAMNFLLRVFAAREHETFLSKIILGLTSRAFRIFYGKALIMGIGLGFFEISDKVKESGHAIGYFQSCYWPQKCESTMRSMLEISTQENKMQSSHNVNTSIVVHVRRGDYKQGRFGLLSEKYYREAIEIARHISNANEILLFSDEPIFAERLVRRITNLPLKLGDEVGDSPIETLEKMRRGNAYVLANSSLSWWSAFLRYDPNAPVIVPDKWFKDIEDPENLIPTGWIRLDSSFE